MDKKFMHDPEQILEQIKLTKTTGRLYQPSATEHRAKIYEENRKARTRAQSARMPFVSDDSGLILYPGLVLVGGISGKGKSTLLSNLLSGFVSSVSDKKGLIITNEDLLASIYDRTACILAKVSFQRYLHGQVSEKEEAEVKKEVESLLQRIEVVDNPDYDMSSTEDVKAVLEYAAKANLGFVAIDYYQTITHSRDNPVVPYYQVLKEFGFWLKNYARQVPEVPVVALVQLAGTTEGGFKERVEADKTIFNHAFQVFELETDPNIRQTKVTVRKDRWGGQSGKEVVLIYEDGRYETQTVI